MEISSKTVFNASFTPGDDQIKVEIEGQEIDQMQMLVSAMAGSDHVRSLILSVADFWRDPRSNMIKQPWKIGPVLLMWLFCCCSCQNSNKPLYIHPGDKILIDCKETGQVIYVVDDKGRVWCEDSTWMDAQNRVNFRTNPIK